jgi:hypothetical protein
MVRPEAVSSSSSLVLVPTPMGEESSSAGRTTSYLPCLPLTQSSETHAFLVQAPTLGPSRLLSGPEPWPAPARLLTRRPSELVLIPGCWPPLLLLPPRRWWLPDAAEGGRAKAPPTGDDGARACMWCAVCRTSCCGNPGRREEN